MVRFPFVFSIPHCSINIPRYLRDSICLNEDEILDSVDLGSREIFANIPVKTIIWARWSRLVVDLNRSPEDLSSRGVVPVLDYHNRRIYRQGMEPGKEDIEERLSQFYWPYHRRLREAIENPDIFGLFDCHSLSAIGPPGAPDAFKWRKDIVLGNNGDQDGHFVKEKGNITCPEPLLEELKEIFERWGFTVSINRPYSGGYITTHYGKEMIKRGKFAIQIEINQSLYLKEDNIHLDLGAIAEITGRLYKIFQELALKL